MRRFSYYPAFLSTIALATATAAMAEPKIISTVDVKPESTLTNQEKETISMSAGQLLIHVDRARTDLKTKNIEAAGTEIDKAIQLGKIIKSVLPIYDIKTEIKAGDQHYTDEAKVQLPLVTLHEELNTVEILKPIHIAKREAFKKTVGVQGRNTVADVEIRDAKAQLDIDSTMAELDDAQKALAGTKFEEADTALKNIEGDIVFEYVVAEMPLEKAQANLILARKAFKENKPVQAKAELQAAADALEQYSKTAGTNREKEIADLRKEIQTLCSEKCDTATSEETITKCWHKLATWSEGQASM